MLNKHCLDVDMSKYKFVINDRHDVMIQMQINNRIKSSDQLDDVCKNEKVDPYEFII